MSNISSAYINAILADAAYIDLNTGVIDTENMQTDDDLPKRMTLPLAKFIADNFEVISNRLAHDIPVLESGFDAIVWKGRQSMLQGPLLVCALRTIQTPVLSLLAAML